MNKLAIFGLFLGLVLLAVLVLYQGFFAIIELFLSSGWSLLWLPVIWSPALLFMAYAWRYAFLPDRIPAFTQLLTAIWMGRSVNSLLPVATIGGEVVKARLLILWGGDTTEAIASVVIDKTVQVWAVIVWGLIGVGILFGKEVESQLAPWILLAVFLLSLCTMGFVLVQKAGFFSWLSRQGSRLIRSDAWAGIQYNAKVIDAYVLELYRQKRYLRLAVFYKTLGLVIQTGEVWLACYLLGHPIGMGEALMLRSLTATASDVAFLIPNAYGIQEGAFIVIGSLLGISPTLALALSIAVRIREFIIELPGLLYWQCIEARFLYTPLTGRDKGQ